MKALGRFLFRVGLALGAAAVASGIVDAQTAADRWQQGAVQGQQRFVEGVQQTQKDPTQLAVQQKSALVNNFNQAVSSGRWERALARVGKGGWQSATLAKAANYGTGISASKDKFATAIAPVLAFEAQLQAQVQSMPKGTLADSLARAQAWITGMYQFGQNR